MFDGFLSQMFFLKILTLDLFQKGMGIPNFFVE